MTLDISLSLSLALGLMWFSGLCKASDLGYVQVGLSNADYWMTVNLEVGTPGQYLSLVLDTGSSDTWFISSKSDICVSNPEYCTWGMAFDQNLSSTYVELKDKPFNVTYYSGESDTGNFMNETVSFLNGASISASLKNVTAGLATADGGDVPSYFGLSYEAFEATMFLTDVKYTYNGILTDLKNAGLIKRRAFSVFMNSASATNGSLVFGGIDRSKLAQPVTGLSTFQVVNVNTTSYNSPTPIQYALQLNKLALTDLKGGKTTVLSSTPMAAMFDTGFWYLAVPSEFMSPIVAKYNATYSDEWGMYMADCSAGDSFTIDYTFGQNVKTTNAVKYPIPGSNFLLDVGESLCLLLAYPYERKDRISVGVPFFRSVYAVFDMDAYQISLGMAKTDVSLEEVEGHMYIKSIESLTTSFNSVAYVSSTSTSKSISTSTSIKAVTISSTSTSTSSSKTTSKTTSTSTSTSRLSTSSSSPGHPVCAAKHKQYQGASR